MSTMTYLTEGTLSHGLRVAVRPMEPSDRMDLIQGFDHLSDETKYRRFVSSKPRLSPADIRHLFDTEELALVLVWKRRSCKDIILSLAHAIRLPGQPEHRRVLHRHHLDEIHGCGAGRLRCRAVAREASRQGITHLTGYMLGTNGAPARLLKAVGTVEYDKIEGGSRDMRVRLPWVHSGRISGR